MLQEELRLAPAEAHVEARGAPAVVGLAEAGRGEHLVDSERAAVPEHDDTRLQAAVPPEPRQDVHLLAVHAPHVPVFHPVVHALNFRTYVLKSTSEQTLFSM